MYVIHYSKHPPPPLLQNRQPVDAGQAGVGRGNQQHQGSTERLRKPSARKTSQASKHNRRGRNHYDRLFCSAHLGQWRSTEANGGQERISDVNVLLHYSDNNDCVVVEILTLLDSVTAFILMRFCLWKLPYCPHHIQICCLIIAFTFFCYFTLIFLHSIPHITINIATTLHYVLAFLSLD